MLQVFQNEPKYTYTTKQKNLKLCTQTYAGSTVCAPSRCCLMTGMHNGHSRLRDNIPHGTFLRDSDITIAEVLRRAGYRTGCIGKWSLGVHGSEGKPNDQGFDDWFGHLDQDQAHFYYPDYLWDNDRIKLLSGNRGEQKQEYTHDLFTDRALNFIDESKEKPFFLYLSYTIPHWSDYPHDSPNSQIVPGDEPYSNRDWPQVEKNYAAMVTRIDRDIGRIIKRLKDLSIDENTIVFFTSDNGPSMEASHKPSFFKSAGPLRGAKRSMYEGGIRIPMIARWPNHIPANSTNHQPFAFWDIMPTLAEIAGTSAPDNIDGISMLPSLHGKEQKQQHEYLYWDYGHARKKYLQAARMGDWKGISNGVETPIELYNLKNDISESNNIAHQHPRIIAQFKIIFEKAYTPSPSYPILTKTNK